MCSTLDIRLHLVRDQTTRGRVRRLRTKLRLELPAAAIVFHNLENNTYFPSPEMWDLKNKANHITSNYNTTGIIQPPIHSAACYKIYESSNNKSFLEKIYPKLLKWHKYLYYHRDFLDDGLVSIIHPWESGMDNSPLWDDVLDKINITEFKYSKMRTDNKKINDNERPEDITYERYISLIELFKECNYNEKLIFKKSKFIIQDVLFNTLLIN